MKLIITRHAKSSWEFPELSDHDRPLTERGRRSSDAIGNWLAENGHIPQVVLSSTSVRTRETWSRMARCFSTPITVEFMPDLYHGGAGSILSVLSMTDASSALVLGHNPGIGYFAQSILRSLPSHADFLRYPTAATLVCEVQMDESGNVELGSGELMDFIVPRDLE
ncbi:MAG: histidine phosphatase family protein [Acidiferrobacterales bacterium]|nr:histidine phosphatase family protein [Acidiferrobacterales bacterium]